MKELSRDIGVGGRLLLAFFGISALAVLGAVAALVTFAEVGSVFDRVTRERIPASLAALELSHQADRIAALAPTILAEATLRKRWRADRIIRKELPKLDKLLAEVKRWQPNSESRSEIEKSVSEIRRNLAQIQERVGNLWCRTCVIPRRDELLSQLTTVANAAQQNLEQELASRSTEATELLKGLENQAMSPEGRRDAIAKLAGSITIEREVQNARVLTTKVHNALVQAAIATEDEIPQLGINLRNWIGNLDEIAKSAGPSIRPALSDVAIKLRALAEGPENIPQLRQKELGIVAEGDRLLQNNSDAAARLSVAINRLLEDERAEIAEAEANVVATQRRSTGVLLGVVALSLVSSALIVWLYVGRSIIRRLKELSGSMLAIAGGNLQAQLPVGTGKDEIDLMANALHVFRNTAVENERIGRLKRFLAPQVAELIVASGDESVLDSHRRDVAVLFCDLRGFTAFAETAEPEEIMDLLRDYHTSLGQLVHKFAGTLERFTGDGLIAIFNDPLLCSDPCLKAARLAVEMRVAVNELIGQRRRLGVHLGFGIGIAYGYATLGRVGFEGRFDYTAIGSVVNLAARLCERAKAGEILVDSKVHAAIEGLMETESLGEFTPKGFSRPVEVVNLVGNKGHYDSDETKCQ
jgi:class 3 adenylate cyclase